MGNIDRMSNITKEAAAKTAKPRPDGWRIISTDAKLMPSKITPAHVCRPPNELYNETGFLGQVMCPTCGDIWQACWSNLRTKELIEVPLIERKA